MFLTANSGLASRFPNKIEFPDYTADELLDITNVLARGKGYRLAESCAEPLRATTSAGRQRMPARRATDVSPAIRWKRPSSTRAAASWQSLRRSWMSSCP